MAMNLKVQLGIYSLGIVLLTIAALLFAAYGVLRQAAIEELGLRAQHVAAVAALAIDGDLHEQVRSNDDAAGEAFTTIREQLRDIAHAMELPHPIYTLRQTNEGMQFVIMTQDETFVGSTYNAALYGVADDMATTLEQGKPKHTDLYTSTSNTYISGYGPIRNSAGAVVALVSIDLTADDVQSALMDKMTPLIWVGLVVALLACVISLGLVTYITKPVRATVAHIQNMLQTRDLTCRLPEESNDEMGQLARWFNSYNESILALIVQLNQNIAKLAQAAEQLSRQSDETNAESQELTGDANRLVTLAGTASGTLSDIAKSAKAGVNSLEEMEQAMQQIQGNMRHMDGAAQAMSGDINEVAASVEELSHTIQDIGSNINEARKVSAQAAETARETNATVNQLDTAAREIGEVVALISKITERTNLLALNASIEAARAGEAGRGFAVVANEVKELANQTAGATEDISRRINAIQSNTTTAIDAIRSINQIINIINTKTGDIAAAVEQQTQTAIEIEERMVSSAQKAHEVSQGVNESAQFSELVTEKSSKVSTAAKTDAEQAGAMYKESLVVKEIGEKVHKRAKLSNSSAERLQQEARGLSEIAQSVSELIGTFKT
ncbi:methyl-accepting chemotaxis protein [Acanthopleuribacter pedis]|uniref:HAMP domain-containing protein n=1 Tax=Acanthopleuribacter pedis TaxID=442870 RepID=A0A8J7Q646_9BACT|nr:HAMP domain-containing methyl-accepting chemotaxis protein [Acanthopleuribacter pedis]MBO1321187.1 HAMP domain-containing protein [Acanthopleuribacter pedis]